MATFTEDIVGGRGYGYGGDCNGMGAFAPLFLLGLLGNRGFGRDELRRDCVDTATHQASLNALQGSFDTNAILAKLASIEGSIPFNEAQMQLALAGAVQNLTQQNTNISQFLGNTLNQLQLSQCMSTSALQKDICDVDTNVDRQSTAIQVAIRDDGEKTRALIVANQIAELNRIAQERQDEIVELRNDNRRDRDRHGLEITMVNNQNQNQLQAQAQNQQISTLLNCFSGLAGQVARATNSNLIVGNTGATVTGPQAANPVNVAA